MVEMLLVSGDLSSFWQQVRSAVSESYLACPIRLSVLAGLMPLLPLHIEDTLDNSGETVNQSTAVADLCSTCATALIGSHSDDTTNSHVISTMFDALVIAAIFTRNLAFCLAALI